MIVTHKIPWDKCLSHQLWPAIEKGWKDEDRPIHFFWGLAGKNIPEIRECEQKGEEWWYVDTGYLSKQIIRYPEPKIEDYDKTYFRIIKGGIHTIRGLVPAEHTRVTELEHKGIDIEFKGWNTKGENIILAPSSPTVTYHINGISQEEWIKQVGEEVRKHTDRPIKVRNKPRPNNEFWGTDIKDDIKNAWCVVTNMSLSAIDGILNMTPGFTHQRNVASLVTSRKINLIEKPFKPGRKTVQEWLNMTANHQFTIQEIEDGLAFDTLKVQYQNGG